MKRFIEGEERSQITLLPECLDDYIADDNAVRVVDVFVDELRLQELGFESAQKDHGDAIRKVCREFVVLCRRLKLFADGIVAVDGSKFKAVNNRDKNFTERKIQVWMQQLETNIKRYLAELDRADRDPTIMLPERVMRLREKVAKIKDQMRGLGEMTQRLGTSGERQVSLTDPDARSMATSRLGSAVVGYNVQTAVDTEHHLIVAHEVTNAVTDSQQLSAMGKLAKQATDHPEPIVLADRGYFEGYEILECERAGIATIVPKPLTSNSKFEGRFDKRDFIYDKQREVYRCPAGQTAIYRFTAVEDGKTLRKYWSSACGGCHLKAQCTPAPQRRISRWEHEDVLEAFKHAWTPHLRPRACVSRPSSTCSEH